jgi:hypothetical protein
LETAHVEPEIDPPQIESWAAESRQETSKLEKEQAGMEVKAAMEMFATTAGETVSLASHMPELHNLSLEPVEAGRRIQELEDKLREKKNA